MAAAQIIRIVALDQTKKAFSSIKRSLGGLMSAIFSMRSALVALAGAAGFGYFIKSNMNAIDAMSKTAQRIGTTTDALSKLQYAGKLTGVEVNTMNMALQRFIRRTAEAAQGTGEAQNALRELGINAAQLQQLPLDERMAVLADAFSNVQNESDKLRIAFKLFDSEGAALVQTLNQGKDGLMGMYSEAEDLGLVMSQQAASGVEKANDAFTKLLSLGRGLALQFSAALAPVLETLSDVLTNKVLTAVKDANGSMKQFGQTLAVDFINMIIKSVNGFEHFVNGIISGVNGVTQSLNAFAIISNMWLGTTYKLFSKIEKVSFGKFIGLLEEAKEITKSVADETEKSMERITVSYKRTFQDKLAHGINQLRKGFTKFSQGVTDISLSLEELGSNAMDNLTQGFTDAITGAKSFASAMKDVAKSVVDSLIKILVQWYLVRPLAEAMGVSMQTATGTKAYGGSVSAGQPIKVGENGEELFIPNTNGAVVANRDLQGGGGVTVVNNINVSTGVQSTVRAEIMTLMPQIANATKAAVADSRMRGGQYSKSLVGA
jgi:hypothetical protein